MSIPVFSETPHLSTREISDFVSDRYGLKGIVKKLDGDISLNFKIETEEKSYILKIANPVESPDSLTAQSKTMSFLSAALEGYNIPDIIPDNNGNIISQITDDRGRKLNARLISFLEGSFLYEEKISSQTAYELGGMLGKIDMLLNDFKTAGAERYWHWDLRNLLELRPLLDEIRDPGVRRNADYFLLQFETEVVPRFSELRRSLIHNDANDHNILLSNGKISGLIDFGDMVVSHTVFEPAVAAAYLMMNRFEPFALAENLIMGYHKNNPLTGPETDVYYFAVAGRLVQSLLISARRSSLNPENEYLTVSAEPAANLLEKFIETNPEKLRRKLREICGFSGNKKAAPPASEILEKRKKYLPPSLSLSYNTPLLITRGSMQYLHDNRGNTYLDCVNNVCHIGHNHPAVVRAARRQMALLNTNTRYLHPNIVRYAELLTSKFPESLNVCFLVNSGSEANELALRLAYTYTGTREMIVLDNAYHGNTGNVIDHSPYKFDGKGGSGPGAYTRKTVMPDLFRGIYRKDESGVAEKYSDFVKKEIEKIEGEGKKLAGFLAESLPGVGGQIIFPAGYLEKVYDLVRKAGGVCIADEVQVGFGRVGKKFWGFELQNVIPDIVTLGKPIGNGHPLGAVVTTREIADAFANGMEYFNTFGGNPVSCAVGMAVLETIEKENLQKHAFETGKYFLKILRELKEECPLIGDVRGTGLFIGVELVRDRKTLEPATEETFFVVEKMKERQVLLSVDGPLRNVIKIKPPLPFNRKNAELVRDGLRRELKALNWAKADRCLI